MFDRIISVGDLNCPRVCTREKHSETRSFVLLFLFWLIDVDSRSCGAKLKQSCCLFLLQDKLKQIGFMQKDPEGGLASIVSIEEFTRALKFFQWFYKLPQSGELLVCFWPKTKTSVTIRMHSVFPVWSMREILLPLVIKYRILWGSKKSTRIGNFTRQAFSMWRTPWEMCR